MVYALDYISHTNFTFTLSFFHTFFLSHTFFQLSHTNFTLADMLVYDFELYAFVCVCASIKGKYAEK